MLQFVSLLHGGELYHCGRSLGGGWVELYGVTGVVLCVEVNAGLTTWLPCDEHVKSGAHLVISAVDLSPMFTDDKEFGNRLRET